MTQLRVCFCKLMLQLYVSLGSVFHFIVCLGLDTKTIWSGLEKDPV